YFGGTLYQDLSLKKGSNIRHNQKLKPDLETHTVEIEKESLLYEILKKDKILVNSFHHMAIKDVAVGMKVTAFSKDGVIEGIEMREKNILAIQWHPEMLSKTNGLMQRLFNYFVSISNKE
ncbi:gamma-glutamyl-gamma-aminobutyrate hydrolase family protein, partial [Cetobacterium sp.]